MHFNRQVQRQELSHRVTNEQVYDDDFIDDDNWYHINDYIDMTSMRHWYPFIVLRFLVIQEQTDHPMDEIFMYSV